MKIILSPAKKMRQDTDSLPAESMPVFLSKAKQVVQYLQSLSGPQLQSLWGCNNEIGRASCRERV